MSAPGTPGCLATIDVVILAGGLGTRLRPAIGTLPKILAPVAGRPFLDHLLDRLAGFGVRRVILALGYRADAVQTAIAARAPATMTLVPLVEPEPLGTAGALRFVRRSILSDPVLVLNGDSVTEVDLCAFLAAHRRTAAAISMVCTEAADTGRFGRIDIAPAGRVAGFREKAETGGPGLINAGIYLLAAPVLDAIAGSAASSFEREILAVQPTGTIHAFAGRFAFIDIGTPQSLSEAATFFARPGEAGSAPT